MSQEEEISDSNSGIALPHLWQETRLRDFASWAVAAVVAGMLALNYLCLFLLLKLGRSSNLARFQQLPGRQRKCYSLASLVGRRCQSCSVVGLDVRMSSTSRRVQTR